MTEEIEVELPHDVIVFLALEAHKQDITLNQYMNDVLRAELVRQGFDPDA